MSLIIAEAGVNHNGDKGLALELVDAAYEAGADIVKFQTFKAKKLVTEGTKKAEYQALRTGGDESQFEMLRRLELSYETHQLLLERCTKLGIEFLSTAFDSDSLKFLTDDLGVLRLKIPSGELTNAPLVLDHALTGRDLIISTGMANLAEIEMALGVIAYGYNGCKFGPPSEENFRLAYSSKEGREALQRKVSILHCTTEYPAPMEEINLLAMDTLAKAFNLPVGYSDHSEGIEVPIAAVARGASIIEKHFTLDKTMDGPDHMASLEPVELSNMVSAIRNIELAMGGSVKSPTVSEEKNKAIARKSLVAAMPIKPGQLFTEENICVLRPGTGTSPYKYWELLGKSAKASYSPGDLILE